MSGLFDGVPDLRGAWNETDEAQPRRGGHLAGGCGAAGFDSGTLRSGWPLELLLSAQVSQAGTLKVVTPTTACSSPSG